MVLTHVVSSMLHLANIIAGHEIWPFMPGVESARKQLGNPNSSFFVFLIIRTEAEATAVYECSGRIASR